MFASPFVGKCLYNYEPGGKQFGFNTSIISLPKENFKNQDGIIPNTKKQLLEKIEKHKFDNPRPLPWYIKLHGSIGWQRENDPTKQFRIIMGLNKPEQIEKELLFTEYFKIFKDFLSEEKSDIFIIGYSFSDEHINEILITAIDSHHIRLHIMNPDPIQKFLDNIKCAIDKHQGQGADKYKKILSSLCGYYQGTLKDLFPMASDLAKHDSYGIRSDSILWQQIRSNFFEE